MYRILNSSMTTFQIDGKRVIEASHIYVRDKSQREIIAEELFDFINQAYDEIGGFKSFKGIQHFIDDSYLWYITYDGEQPSDLKDFDISKVYVVSVFRQKYGLKMVGLARRRILRSENNRKENMELRQKANAAVTQHIKFISKIGWAEVSDKLETFFHQTLSIHDIIDPYDLKDHKIFKDIDIDLDEFHYYRSLRKGESPLRKIAYGTIKF